MNLTCVVCECADANVIAENDLLGIGVRAHLSKEMCIRALKSRDNPQFCRWSEDSGGTWKTECGHAFQFTAGCPQENRASFCQYCGGHLVDIPFVDSDSIEEIDCRSIVT